MFIVPSFYHSTCGSASFFAFLVRDCYDGVPNKCVLYRKKFTPPIISDRIALVPNADFYHLGILTSAMHMAWVRTVAGRLKSDYLYSVAIAYNNFPWPSSTGMQPEFATC